MMAAWFSPLVLGLLVMLPGALHAADQLPRVGVLSSGTQPSATQATVTGSVRFIEGLGELGYIDGGNIVLDIRYTAARSETYLPLARELIDLKPDVIVASGDRCNAAQALTKTIPIVCATLNDPVNRRLVASYARPGGNLTGTQLLTPELFHKRFELVKELFPGGARIVVLWRNDEGTSLKEAEYAARLLGLAIEPRRADSAADLEPAFRAAVELGAQAVVTTQGPFFNANGQIIADLGLRHRLATVTGESGFAARGGLLQFGPDVNENWHRAASFVDRILKGAKAGDLPVEQPATIKLILNLKTARALGLIIPEAIFARADEVIR